MIAKTSIENSPLLHLDIIIQKVENITSKVTALHIIVLGCILVSLSMIHNRGGILNEEMIQRIPYYLSDKPLVNKLFDSKVLDLYRARELSYFFDYIDCRFFAWSVITGFPHFYSLIHYLFTIIIGLLLWHFGKTDLKLKSWAAIALIGLYWTSPSVFLGGTIFRTAKIGTALATALLCIYVYRITLKSRENIPTLLSGRFWCLFFLVSFSATLFDEQGLFLVGTVIVFSLVWMFQFKDQSIRHMLLVSMAVLAFHTIYRVFIAPYLTFTLNGYYPDFSYQVQFLESIGTQSLLLFFGGLIMYIDTLRFLVGNFIAPVFLAFLFIHIREQYKLKDRKLYRLVFIDLFLTAVLLVILMNALMLLRHPPLFWEDVRRVYYWTPTNTMLVFIVAFLISLVNFDKKIYQRITFVVLTLSVLFNIAAIPRHTDIIRHGHMQPAYVSSPEILDALKHMDEPDYTASSAVLQNPVYQYFANK